MIINEDEYLEHFGVKGMKWGVRKQKVLNAKSEYKKARKAGLGKDQLNSAKNAYKNAKRERENAINKTYRSINKNSSFGEKLIYNDATRRKAAQYVVDNDMSVDEAIKKSNSEAIRNTAMFIAAYGAVSVASGILSNHR